MFGEILQAPRKFIARLNSLYGGNLHDQAAEKQLKTDLTTAAKAGIARMRLHDHTLPSDGTTKDVKTAKSTSVHHKRKSGGSERYISEQSSAKRRRVSLDTGANLTYDSDESSNALDDTIVLAVPKEPTNGKESGSKGDVKDTPDMARWHGRDVEVRVSKSEQLLFSPDSPSASLIIGAAKTTNSAFDVTDRPRTTENARDEYNSVAIEHGLGGGVRKSEKKGDEGKSGFDRSRRSETIQRVNPGDSRASKNIHTTKVPIHTRFGSEEPDNPVKDFETHTVDETNALTTGSYPVTVEDESEDDAPETITATAGLVQSRLAIAEAAKAVKRQARSDKERRRKRDANLKKQAESAKKRRPKQETSPPTDLDEERYDFDSNSSDEPQGFKVNSRKRLPLLLPDEILAIEPAIRLPTPPLDSIPKPQKRKFVDPSLKPPKDVKRGFVKVRVLEPMKSTLPPKNSKGSKSLKESWLSGRQGARGGLGSSRRKMGGGFVRK